MAENTHKGGQGGNKGGPMRRGGPDRGGRRGPRPEREKPEFDQKTIAVRRVARVVAGGRRFSFAVVIVAGNRKGKVGVGVGKAGDTSLAINKALRNAKKHMVTLKLTKENSIPHETEAKYCSARVVIRPARGRGLVAGSAMRTVLALAGVTDVSTKLVSRSKNKLNIARATMVALRPFVA